MSRYSHPTSAQVRATAQKAIDAFAYYGLACCLVGGAACQLYGTSRTPGVRSSVFIQSYLLILNPQDVDIVILTTSYDTERLKAMLVARDPTFYLRLAKTFGATYKVLWARIVYSYAQSDACKVDILTPGIMNIPDVPREHIVTIETSSPTS